MKSDLSVEIPVYNGLSVKPVYSELSVDIPVQKELSVQQWAYSQEILVQNELHIAPPTQNELRTAPLTVFQPTQNGLSIGSESVSPPTQNGFSVMQPSVSPLAPPTQTPLTAQPPVAILHPAPELSPNYYSQNDFYPRKEIQNH